MSSTCAGSTIPCSTKISRTCLTFIGGLEAPVFPGGNHCAERRSTDHLRSKSRCRSFALQSISLGLFLIFGKKPQRPQEFRQAHPVPAQIFRLIEFHIVVDFAFSTDHPYGEYASDGDVRQ